VVQASSVEERIRRIPPSHTPIRIERYSEDGGRISTEVFIAGTSDWGVVQLDQATQQNAALVEEASAAAHSLREHAQDLQAAVGNFKLGETRLAQAA
jgi:hypothetical protein